MFELQDLYIKFVRNSIPKSYIFFSIYPTIANTTGADNKIKKVQDLQKAFEVLKTHIEFLTNQLESKDGKWYLAIDHSVFLVSTFGMCYLYRNVHLVLLTIIIDRHDEFIVIDETASDDLLMEQNHSNKTQTTPAVIEYSSSSPIIEEMEIPKMETDTFDLESNC